MVPPEIKRDLFYALTDGFRRLSRAKGLSQEAVVADFRPPSRLVVDANPILAALLGGQARRVFFETPVREFAVPEILKVFFGPSTRSR